MKRVIKSGRDNTFSVKFKGKVYDDAWQDSTGHIWFDGNLYEYVPSSSYYNPAYVLIHDFKQTSNGYTAAFRKSKAKVEILDGPNVEE